MDTWIRQDMEVASEQRMAQARAELNRQLGR